MTQHKYHDIYLLLIVLVQFIRPHAFSPGGLGDIVRDQHEMTYHGGVIYISTPPLEVLQYISDVSPYIRTQEAWEYYRKQHEHNHPPNGGVIYNTTSPWKSLDIHSAVFLCILSWRAWK